MTADPKGRWAGLRPPDAARILRAFDRPWWIAGGWSVDMFVGRQSRPHADMDIAILRRDQARLAEVLTGWDLFVAMDGGLTLWSPDDPLEGGRRHQLWARPSAASAWALELLMEESDGESWIYRRDPGVRRPLSQLGARSPDGVPFLRPEVALLYKSGRETEPRHAADFETALPHLGSYARQWLADALDRTRPEHPWRVRLAGPSRP